MAVTSDLPYLINDADNHFNQPLDCFERYIDPSQRDLAIRYVTGPDGKPIQLFNGKPAKFHADQITFSEGELAKMLGDTSKIEKEASASSEGQPGKELGTIPGMLLNRLNPLRGLSEEERNAFVAEFREKSEGFDDRDLRLSLMDDQGIDKGIMYPGGAILEIEFEIDEDIDALYANIRAFNRWIVEELAFVVEKRMWFPPYIALADPELAVKELETVVAQGATMIQIKRGHAHGGRDNPSRRTFTRGSGLRPVLEHRQRGGHPRGGASGRYRLPEVRGGLVRRSERRVR